MIFKFQKSRDGKRIYIFNSKNQKILDDEYKEEYDVIFGERRKRFFKGKIDRRNRIKIQCLVSDRDW